MTSPAWETEADGSAIDFLLDAERRWSDACLACTLLALSPKRLGGVVIEGGPSPARDAWLALFDRLSPAPRLTLPATVKDADLTGGPDLIAGLVEGRIVTREGLLSAGRERPILVRMADGLETASIYALAHSLDKQELGTLILFDESDESAPHLEPLRERLAFKVNLDGIPMELTKADPPQIPGGERRLAHVSDETVKAFSAVGASFGIASFRAELMAVAAAQLHAALMARDHVAEEDIETAARLVLIPRVRQIPHTDQEQNQQGNDAPEGQDAMSDSDGGRDESETPDDTEADRDESGSLEEALIEAVASGAVSLAKQRTDKQALKSKRAPGKTGTLIKTARKGRPLGSEPGDPRRGRRLDVLATLRAAVPWQKLRPAPIGGSLLRIYPSDLRVSRYAHKTGSSVIFIVDASGSSAMSRLAEAKGAVESLLAECYSRRDVVSLVVCRGEIAEVALPPSRSLTRARRAMAGLPGGGGTPLASALALSLQTALTERGEGRAPLIVILSDGKANVTLEGVGGRAQATEEAKRMSALIRSASLDALFFDTSPRGEERARDISTAMDASYVHLPYAEKNAVATMVSQERAVLRSPGR